MSAHFFCETCKHVIANEDVDMLWGEPEVVGDGPPMVHRRPGRDFEPDTAAVAPPEECGPVIVKPAPKVPIAEGEENFKRIADILRRSGTEDAEALIRCLEINMALPRELRGLQVEIDSRGDEGELTCCEITRRRLIKYFDAKARQSQKEEPQSI